MLRDLEAFVRSKYDVLVIGGGIHGLFAAYDAASRGLSVALVDRSDFGSGLSFNHQRTLHGGLRALQTGHVRKTRQQILERRTWARIAPHLLRPLPFLVATTGWTTRSRSAVRLGFAIYDLVGRKRNTGVSPELHLPKPKLESAAATKRLFPGVNERGLSGGAVWYDYQIRHADRLTWTVALAAREAGARLMNYVEALGPASANGGGARVRDLASGQEAVIDARTIVVAAGSGMGSVLGSFDVPGAPPLLRAMNLLLNRPARDIATAAPASSGRMLTAVPWQGYVLVGTHQSQELVNGNEDRPPEQAIDAFLADANTAFPRLSAKRGDIRLVHYGLVPAVAGGRGADLLPEPVITKHNVAGGSTLVSLVGVKYTTARWAAEHAIDLACRELGGHHRRSRTASSPLPHAGIADVEGRLVETLRALGVDLDRDVIDHLTGWYGTEASDVVRHAADTGRLDRLAPTTPVLSGEISYAAANADAVRLSDVVLRRTPLGAAGHPGRDALDHAAAIMASAGRWSDEERAEEVRATEEIYRV
ncbi:MAG TPA: FAD-dependent oxidoreductase [Vicinamibacterales bacterium]|nr:FAD-dependent oxidoreductase [Vicinamibacterales bacterium]